MDTIKAQLLRIQQQLSGLSASQKMLTASLLAIMLMTVVWWGRYAGTAQTVPVLDQPLPPETLGQIQMALMSHGIRANITDDRVMVPADRKMEAVAMLGYSNALPAGGANAWDEMIKMMSPWDTSPKTQAIQNHLRERMLSQAMTSFFPGVSRANVLINSVSERRIGARIEPSASVQITTRGGERNLRALVEGVASTVASAVPGLKRSAVSIVIDGMLHRPHDPDEGFLSGDLYESIANQEKGNVEKISALMPPNSLVAVKVDIETSSSQATREAYDEKTTLVKEKSSETLTQESSQALSNAADPGAISNTGTANSGLELAASQAGPTNTTEKTRVENQVLPGKTHEVIHKPAGKPTVISAAVRIPRSFFVMKFKQSNPASAAEPDEPALQGLLQKEIPTYVKIVQSLTDIRAAEAVSIDMYDDFAVLATAANPVSSGTSAIGAMVGTHAREIALGVLAVLSLFMVSMIVRKGPQPPVIAETEQPVETPRLEAGEDLAGIVGGEASATLDGMELDEDSIKAQQVVHQVATMVKEDPDAAANLVKRWLNRS
jgi:flagellar biosynthesis/type III secretory pathway M-ring protein FliF/YscJ